METDTIPQNEMLGNEGLTITNANHLANIAKEMYESAESRLESLKFYSRDFQLAINGNTYRVENESAKEELETLSESLMEVGELKSLIAYLREAIKAKEALDEEGAFDKYVKSIIEKGRADLKCPEREEYISFASEFNKLTAQQKADYYALEARCSTLGKFLHPEGAFAEAREEFYEHKKNPTQVCGKGQDAEISTFSSSFTTADVDGAFFTLQKEYRNQQAQLNKLKAEIEEKVNTVNKEIDENFVTSTRLWIGTRSVEKNKWNEYVKALKIVVPQNLQSIFDKVNAVASLK